MGMTREEAIKALRIEGIEIGGKAKRLVEFMAALDVAQEALRPVSQEQVEKSWRGEWKENKNVAIESAICSKCKTVFQAYYGNYQFCPRCGAPMTDEAVDMVMERLEALNEKD